MNLSQTHKEELFKMIQNGFSQASINHWLMNICHLSFRDAALIRKEALESLGTDLNQARDKERENKLAEVAKAESAKAFLADDTSTPTPEALFDFEALHKEWDTPRCVSCQDETFSCPCPVKYLEQIPF